MYSLKPGTRDRIANVRFKTALGKDAAVEVGSGRLSSSNPDAATAHFDGNGDILVTYEGPGRTTITMQADADTSPDLETIISKTWEYENPAENAERIESDEPVNEPVMGDTPETAPETAPESTPAAAAQTAAPDQTSGAAQPTA